ncbi:MAG: alpha/beta hydrolase [Actinobacteria bacterium]|nr:alpha/beta hydrolase [Actinomycetota bacterium]
MTTFSSYDGTRLSYAEVGSGPPLVCLPGGPGRAAAYLEDLGGLSTDRTLVLLDSRATGRSEVPADPASLRFDRLAEDVEALRVHLGEERLALLGHSAGTMVAQAWASAHPDRVDALVLVTPSGRLQGSDRTDVAQLVAARADEPWYAEAREALDALETAPPQIQQQLWRAARPFMYGRWDERTQAHAATAETQTSKRAELGFRPAREEDVDVAALLGGLREVTAPVLVLAGERDALTGVAAAHAVAASFDGARVVVLPRAGHFPWVDEPAAFAEAVREVLV